MYHYRHFLRIKSYFIFLFLVTVRAHPSSQRAMRGTVEKKNPNGENTNFTEGGQKLALGNLIIDKLNFIDLLLWYFLR